MKRRRIKKLKKDIYVKQLWYLAGGLILCAVALMLIPTVAGTTGSGALNELDQREAMSRAADDYMLASTTAERQKAYNNVNGIRSGSRNVEGADSNEIYGFLRVLVIGIIVILAWNLGAMIYRQTRPLKPNRA